MERGPGAKVEAGICGEVQLMLDFYLRMRKKTHMWYKVVRAENGGELHLDCRDDAADREGHAEDAVNAAQREHWDAKEAAERSASAPPPPAGPAPPSDGGPGPNPKVSWNDMKRSIERFFAKHSPSNLEPMAGPGTPSKADKMFAQIRAQPRAIPQLFRQLHQMFGEGLDIEDRFRR
jgi:hypothetical protein